MRALAATGSSSVQDAIDWILAFGGEGSPGSGPSSPSRQQQQQQQQQVAAGAALGSAGPLTAGLSSMAQRQQQPMPDVPQQAYPSVPRALGGAEPYQQQPYQQQPSAAAYGGAASQWGDTTFSNPLLAGLQPQQQQQQAPPPRSTAASRPVGVAGLMQLESSKAAASGSTLEQAFQDLHALMAMAQQMVTLAEKFRWVGCVVCVGSWAAAALRAMAISARHCSREQRSCRRRPAQRCPGPVRADTAEPPPPARCSGA